MDADGFTRSVFIRVYPWFRMLAVTMGGMSGTLDFAEFARSSLGTLRLRTADEH